MNLKFVYFSAIITLNKIYNKNKQLRKNHCIVGYMTFDMTPHKLEFVRSIFTKPLIPQPVPHEFFISQNGTFTPFTTSTP